MGSSIQKVKSNRQREQNSYTIHTSNYLHFFEHYNTPKSCNQSRNLEWSKCTLFEKKKKCKCEMYKKILLRSVTHCGDNREAHYSTEIVVGQEPAACCHTPHDARKESYMKKKNIILYKMTLKVCGRKIIQKEVQIKLK